MEAKVFHHLPPLLHYRVSDRDFSDSKNDFPGQIFKDLPRAGYELHVSWILLSLRRVTLFWELPQTFPSGLVLQAWRIHWFGQELALVGAGWIGRDHQTGRVDHLIMGLLWKCNQPLDLRVSGWFIDVRFAYWVIFPCFLYSYSMQFMGIKSENGPFQLNRAWTQSTLSRLFSKRDSPE